jgi:hypothetical protein
MTVERRFVAGLADVRAVTLECTRCKSRLTLAPEKVDATSLHSCPSCAQDWLSSAGSHEARGDTATYALVDALRRACEEQSKNRHGFRLLFEFDEPVRS